VLLFSYSEDAMKLDTKRKTLNLDAFAFYQGAQGVPLQHTLEEIAAAHDTERAKLQEESARREKPMEAIIDRLEKHRPEVDDAWGAVARRLGPLTPPAATAIIVGIMGVAALAVDAVLVGPGLDAVGISDPLVQFVAAFGLAALSATLFHLAYETIGQHRHTAEIAIVRRALAGFAILALLAWGVLRGYQVKFAADIAHNPLGGFLGEHPMLASLFFCFVTLAAPLVGAAAFHDAAPRIFDLLTWKRARHSHEELHKELGIARKNLEEQRVVLDKGISQLDAQQRSWEAAAAQYHDRGRTNGARQDPHWLVLLKSTGWSLGGLVLGSVLGAFLAPLYFVLPIGVWTAAFLYYRRARFYPTYDEFKRLENTRFAIGTDRPQSVGTATPKLLPPSEDE